MIQILNRLIQSAISLFILASLCFFLLKAFPGSPLDQEVQLNPQIAENLKSFYGLNEPLAEQYLHFFRNILHGDLGISMHFEGRSVTSVIAQGLPVTLSVGGLALLVSIILGFVFGFMSARFPSLEKLHEGFILSSISVPTLMLGPLLIWFFGFQINILPVALLESASSYILPVFLLSLRPVAVLSKLLKDSLKEAMQSDYSRTAKAIGLSPSQILFRWALRNSLVPYLSYVSILVAGLLSGSLIVEMLFAIPGLGTQFLDALLNRDYSLIVGLALFYGFLLSLTQVIVDILIQALDPRIESL